MAWERFEREERRAWHGMSWEKFEREESRVPPVRGI